MSGQMSTLDRHDGTSWMSHDREVLAHLRVVVDEVRSVTVEAGGCAARGVLSIDSRGEGGIVVALGAGAVLPAAAPGMVVKVAYSHASVAYEFLTAVRDRGDHGRLEVAVPRVVERRERRAAPQLNVYKGRWVRLATDWGADLAVFDISTSGIGLVAQGDDVRRALASGVRGVLSLHRDTRVNVWLDVRHTRTIEDLGGTLIGARFLGLSSRDGRIIETYINARLTLP